MVKIYNFLKKNEIILLNNPEEILIYRLNFCYIFFFPPILMIFKCTLQLHKARKYIQLLKRMAETGSSFEDWVVTLPSILMATETEFESQTVLKIMLTLAQQRNPAFNKSFAGHYDDMQGKFKLVIYYNLRPFVLFPFSLSSFFSWRQREKR